MQLDGDTESDFAIGIDLGTTNTVVAYMDGGQVALVPSGQGHFLHPSVVAFKPSGERIVGIKARLRRLVDPENTIFSAKRIIGRPFRTEAVQNAIARLPYRVEAGHNDEPVVVTRAGEMSVIEISSFLLAHIKEATERHLGRPVSHCVVTVPANFSDGQRAATRRAAELAGFQVLRVLNEPTAAALAYGMGRNLNQRVVVFDMGGGTFDATVLNIKNNMFEVVATGGDPFLGGDDMDEELGKVLAAMFVEQHGVEMLRHRHAAAKTIIAAEQVKMQLSEEDAVEGTISELDYGEGGVPLGLDFHITRLEFEKVISPYVGRAILYTEQVLQDAGLTPQLIDEVVLVGGATLVPVVARRVRETFGKEPRRDVDPMLAVAMGAAIQADALMHPTAASAAPGETSADGAGGMLASEKPLLMDVTAHGLGVAMADKYTEFLIEKNTQIPVDRTRVFSTSHDDQTAVQIKVCQGEARLFTDNHPLGSLEIEGLRPGPRGATRIEVTFLLDADGILQVTARDLGTGKSQKATLRVSGVGDHGRVDDV